MVSLKKIFCSLFLLVTLNNVSVGQKRQITDLLHKEVFKMPSNGIRENRPPLAKHKKQFNPVNILSGSLLSFYQNIVSEQLSGSCSFEISCSEYTKKSIEQLGWFKGVFIGLNQYTNCVPRNHEHHSECAVNQDMKIINYIGNE